MFTASTKAMSACFELLSSHLRVAFTHSGVQVRKLALGILVLVFDKFPTLARKDNELYESFLALMKSSKKPNVRPLLQEVVEKFRLVYEGPEASENAVVFEVPPSDGWDARTLEAFACRFQFPVFYGHKSTSKKTTDTSFLDQIV